MSNDIAKYELDNEDSFIIKKIEKFKKKLDNKDKKIKYLLKRVENQNKILILSLSFIIILIIILLTFSLYNRI